MSQAGLWTEVRVAHVWGYPVRSCEDELVIPAKCGKGATRIANTDVRSPAERRVAMSWAQRLKRVFNIDRGLRSLQRIGNGFSAGPLDNLVAGNVAHTRSGMSGYELCDHRRGKNF